MAYLKIDPVVNILLNSQKPLSLSDIMNELARIELDAGCSNRDLFQRSTMNRITKLLHAKIIIVDSVKKPKLPKKGRPYRLYKLNPEEDKSDIIKLKIFREIH